MHFLGEMVHFIPKNKALGSESVKLIDFSYSLFDQVDLELNASNQLQ